MRSAVPFRVSSRSLLQRLSTGWSLVNQHLSPWPLLPLPRPRPRMDDKGEPRGRVLARLRVRDCLLVAIAVLEARFRSEQG